MSEFEFPADEVDADDIEPGSPRAENAVVVALGALAALAVFQHVATLFGVDPLGSLLDLVLAFAILAA